MSEQEGYIIKKKHLTEEVKHLNQKLAEQEHAYMIQNIFLANEIKCLSEQIKREVAATLDSLQRYVVLQIKLEQTSELEVFEDVVDSETTYHSQASEAAQPLPPPAAGQPQPDTVTPTTDATLSNKAVTVKGSLHKHKDSNFFSHELELQDHHYCKIIKDKFDETYETSQLETEAAAALSLQQLSGASNVAAAASKNQFNLSLESKNIA
eukprot:12799008-Ditylum_brightwellii.AAC.1